MSDKNNSNDSSDEEPSNVGKYLLIGFIVLLVLAGITVGILFALKIGPFAESCETNANCGDKQICGTDKKCVAVECKLSTDCTTGNKTVCNSSNKCVAPASNTQKDCTAADGMKGTCPTGQICLTKFCEPAIGCTGGPGMGSCLENQICNATSNVCMPAVSKTCTVADGVQGACLDNQECLRGMCIASAGCTGVDGTTSTCPGTKVCMSGVCVASSVVTTTVCTAANGMTDSACLATEVCMSNLCVAAPVSSMYTISLNGNKTWGIGPERPLSGGATHDLISLSQTKQLFYYRNNMFLTVEDPTRILGLIDPESSFSDAFFSRVYYTDINNQFAPNITANLTGVPTLLKIGTTNHVFTNRGVQGGTSLVEGNQIVAIRDLTENLTSNLEGSQVWVVEVV